MRKRVVKQVMRKVVPGGTLPAQAVRVGLGWAASRLLRKASRRTLGYTAAGVVAASAAAPVARYVAGKLRREHA